MELTKIKLRNFRGYQDIEITLSKGLQMFVGKNDIGKSTIFEALDIFFNDKDANVKISLDDLNVQAKQNNETIVSISCLFLLTDEDRILIETVEVDPQEEFLLNKDGLLEVIKEWDFSLQTLKFASYINCNMPDSISSDLLTAKQADLKRKVKELGIENAVNMTINSSMRKGIYESLSNSSTSWTERKIPTKNMLAEKDIFDNISKSFPDFYLFKADRKNSTSDDEIQNPMSLAVKHAFESEEIKAKISEIEEIIRKQLNDVNRATIEKLQELNVDYGNALLARITANWSNAIKNDIIDGNNVPINKRGSGIRRLLLLSYLMVEAEKKSFNKNKRNIIFAIEEPETALHPTMQRKFIEQLIYLSKLNRFDFGEEIPSNAMELKKYQVFITTHLPNFISYATPEQIIYLHKENNKIKRYCEPDLKDFIQNEMGKFPIIDYKYIIFVEGENDVHALKRFGNIPELKAIFDIDNNSVNIVPLQGGNLLKCIELDYFWDLPVKQFHLYDGDIPKYRTEIIEKRCNLETNKKVRGTVTTLKEMENYIPKLLIEKNLGLCLDDYTSKWHDLDFNIVNVLLNQNDTSVAQFNSIKNNISDYKRREQAMKSYLNKTILKGVTKEMLETHGVYDEIKSWFVSMKNLLEYNE